MKIQRNRYLQGDSLKLLKSLPDNSVDLVFADPPYFLQLNRTLSRPNKSMVDSVDDTWDKFLNFQDYDTFTHKWLSACKVVMKETSTIWVMGTYHNIYRNHSSQHP